MGTQGVGSSAAHLRRARALADELADADGGAYDHPPPMGCIPTLGMMFRCHIQGAPRNISFKVEGFSTVKL